MSDLRSKVLVGPSMIAETNARQRHKATARQADADRYGGVARPPAPSRGGPPRAAALPDATHAAGLAVRVASRGDWPVLLADMAHVSRNLVINVPKPQTRSSAFLRRCG